MAKRTEIPLEKIITGRIVAELRSEGYPFVIKTHGAAYQIAGLPDILLINRKGRFVGLEVKRPIVGRTTELQLKMLALINSSGGYAAIVHNAEEAVKAVNESERQVMRIEQ